MFPRSFSFSLNLCTLRRCFRRRSPSKPQLQVLYQVAYSSFQQNSTPLYAAKRGKARCEGKLPVFITVEEWPASSSELNPFEKAYHFEKTLLTQHFQLIFTALSIHKLPFEIKHLLRSQNKRDNFSGIGSLEEERVSSQNKIFCEYQITDVLLNQVNQPVHKIPLHFGCLLISNPIYTKTNHSLFAILESRYFQS